jgi:hypothetical protein
MRRVWPLVGVLGLLLAVGVETACPQDQSSSSQQNQEKKTDKKKSKKKEQASSSSSETDAAARDRRAIRMVVDDLQDGFEGHSPQRVSNSLDQSFYDYPHFEDQVTQFLEQNSEIRLYFRDATTEVKGDKATVIVDAEMAFSTKAAPSKEQMRRARVQFDFIRTDKGWKIYEISPRSFFTF